MGGILGNPEDERFGLCADRLSIRQVVLEGLKLGPGELVERPPQGAYLIDNAGLS
jgi:hypothetical protein